jgi:hypothetical protein
VGRTSAISFSETVILAPALASAGLLMAEKEDIGGYEAPPADDFTSNEKAEDAEDAQPISSKFAKKVVNELYERYNTLVRARLIPAAFPRRAAPREPKHPRVSQGGEREPCGGVSGCQEAGVKCDVVRVQWGCGRGTDGGAGRPSPNLFWGC